MAIPLYPDRLEVSAENAIVACHTRLLDRDQVSYDWQHYIPLIERKPGALRNGAPFADIPMYYWIGQGTHQVARESEMFFYSGYTRGG